MRQQRRDLDRYPAVYSVCAIECWPKQVGSLRNVLERQVEENRLSLFPAEGLLADRGVISRTVLDVVVEDCGIRGEPGHRELIDVTSKCPAGQKISSNVVEPEALSETMKFLGCIHVVSPLQLTDQLHRKASLAKIPVEFSPIQPDKQI
jgi:hypothetical protein